MSMVVKGGDAQQMKMQPCSTQRVFVEKWAAAAAAAAADRGRNCFGKDML
jgi:hypothetical protein